MLPNLPWLNFIFYAHFLRHWCLSEQNNCFRRTMLFDGGPFFHYFGFKNLIFIIYWLVFFFSEIAVKLNQLVKVEQFCIKTLFIKYIMWVNLVKIARFVPYATFWKIPLAPSQSGIVIKYLRQLKFIIITGHNICRGVCKFGIMVKWRICCAWDNGQDFGNFEGPLCKGVLFDTITWTSCFQTSGNIWTLIATSI